MLKQLRITDGALDDSPAYSQFLEVTAVRFHDSAVEFSTSDGDLVLTVDKGIEHRRADISFVAAPVSLLTDVATIFHELILTGELTAPASILERFKETGLQDRERVRLILQGVGGACVDAGCLRRWILKPVRQEVLLTGAGPIQQDLRVLGDSDSSQTVEQIRRVIADYVAGWREGDVERLASDVFAGDDGHVIWVSTEAESGDEKVSSMTFTEVLERGSRPQPEYGLRYEIQSLDVIDDRLAVAQVEQSRKGGSYVDILVLYRVSGEWKVVTKTFVSRP